MAQRRPLLLDGATGTMLQAAGMPPGLGPERFCAANPDVLVGIHKAYLDAGADIITSCTFGGNACKLPAELDVHDFSKSMVELARQARDACGRPAFVAGNVGPTGRFAKPLGDIAPGDLIDVFAAQIRGLVAGGCDLVFIETQFDLAEARAAVIAARRVCDLPVMVSMTFEDGKSLTGSTPAIFARTMVNMGVDVVGTNCSLGPEGMAGVVSALVASSSCPVLAEPNAGLPRLEGNVTVFPLGPEPYARQTAAFLERGVRILGGCCGTTPDHIRELARIVKTGSVPAFTDPPGPKGVVLTSRSKMVSIEPDVGFVVIGERINPTGKKKLAGQLQAGRLDMALELADRQVEAGASIFDVNVGAPLVDETVLLPSLVQTLTARHDVPLSLDSPNRAALAACLPLVPGSCLVNSISGEADRLETLGPLCKLHGTPFILLPLKGAELPVTAAARIAIAEELLGRAEEMGIPRHLILVDVLALAISANGEGGRECLRMLRWCRSRGLTTTIGLSNISFGLPARGLLNATFMSMAVGAGLASCIADPSAPRVREALDAMAVLQGADRGAERFIAAYGEWKPSGGAVTVISKSERGTATTSSEAVLAGDLERVIALLDGELAGGADPLSLIEGRLLPAITEVGARYERKEYFLPQLIRSAETMQKAFAHLKPLLADDGEPTARPVVVLATVEGDIHDIGKNIVALLLENHGFTVVDAGKDVPAEDIVACAVEHEARIIGLSALMTTTMVRMEDTVALVRKRNLPIRVMVGGAAVTQAFADAIGADAYCVDAVSGVRAAKSFVEDGAGVPEA
ncbi:MAG: homocysteine S-methyltransferase family protein [Desulfovibrio sp.]|nr:homocysteine S-methyltransferase family protein [Desulfovibrio sp.]